MDRLEVHCVNHPQRRAIGRCVVTGQPLCAECSTRIEGVNYSREGLERLRRRQAEGRSGGAGQWGGVLAGLLSGPVLLLASVYFMKLAVGLLMELGQAME